MSRAEPLKRDADYYTIKEGSFRLPSTSDDTEARRREYTNPKTGEHGVVYERAFRALIGHIENVRFSESTLKDGTVLRSLNIILDADETGRVKIISVAIDGRYATDFLKKLPNIDVSKEVRLVPFDFEKDGPRRVGIAVFHPDANGVFGISVRDAFMEVEGVEGSKVYTALHGFPEPSDEDKEDWPFYFKKVSKFLVAYTKEHVLPKFSDSEKQNRAMDNGLDEVFERGNKDYPPNADEIAASIPF